MHFQKTFRVPLYLTAVTLCLALMSGGRPAKAASHPTMPLGYVGVVPRAAPILTPVSLALAPETPSSKAAPKAKPKPTAKRTDEETLITSDRMSFDQEKNVAVAEGHVEIARSGYVLHADKVTYDQNSGVMRAEGHVALLHPDGEVSFADEQEITGDMKQAFVKNVGVLFPDNSRMAARTAQRYDNRYFVADKGVYTACNVCKENPDNPPLWQLRADQIVHDNENHDIYYHDATLDFAGVPVFYTPYFSTPDPTVKRREGFLMPTAGYTPQAGYFLNTPYYIDIAPDKDAVFAPTFSTIDKLQLGGQYRERFAKGRLQLDGTIAYAELLSENTGESKGDRLRGNLKGDFLYNIDNMWRAGTRVDYVSDKSYLERYNLGSPASTESRAFAERFQGRDYTVVNSYYFQDLRPGTQPVQPFVLPSTTFSLLGEPGQTLGGRWSLDGGTLITHRDNSSAAPAEQGPDTRRFSINGGWERRLISDTGLVTTVNGLARADVYWADNVPNSDPNSNRPFNDVLLGRQFEQANATFSYPLARHGEGYQQVLEPIVMLTAAPDVKPDPYQPIEESLSVQFDETNLFAPNRFTGGDLIEGGNRITYGLRQSLVTDGGAHYNIFAGQSYNFSSNSLFPELSGLEDHASDYVGRISLAPGPWLYFDYGFRFSHNDFSPEAQDAHLSFGSKVFRPSLRYVLAYQTLANGTVGTTEEIIPSFSTNFAKYWTFNASYTHAFQPDPGPRQTALGLTYADECFIFGLTAQRNDLNRRDIKSGTSVMFHIYFKNIGGIHTDSPIRPTFPTEYRQTD